MIDTTLPNIGDRWKELLLPIHNDKTERERIKTDLRAAFVKKWDIQNDFDTIKKSLK
jgi:type I restriction enzyme M protein